ncbi:MAG: hypothetical protein MI867_24660 [Pseudomonadales bacterium]|nr:hypothetical protein [Pseudomonadales bacterium]
MEPESINRLVKEAEEVKCSVRDRMGDNIALELSHLFDDTCYFFEEYVLGQWQLEKRFDELIDYILYLYADGGGNDFWKQILLDLRQGEDEDRGHKLLDGLYSGRLNQYKIARRNFKKNPNNHFSAAACAEAKGEVMKVLYEHAFLLENKPEHELNHERVALVRERIWLIERDK